MADTELSQIQEIYQRALGLDFALQKGAGESHLMPLRVIEHLCEILNADGGNFTIYHCDDDYLDVRAWYSKIPGMKFPEFRNKIKTIGADPSYRIQSSSYRCFDTKQPLLIKQSSLTVTSQMTLDVATLTLKENLSAVAVPFIYHGQSMGVLNMDRNDAEKSFTEDDLGLLQKLSVFLPPILHNSLTIETITKINQLIFDKRPDEHESVVLGKVCKLICDFLFVPWAGVFLAHESIENRISLTGWNGRILKPEYLDTLRIIDTLNLGSPTLHVLEGKTSTSEGTLNECFPLMQLPTDVPCEIFRLTDKSELVDGFLVLAGFKNPSESFRRLCNFIADFTSLTLGALAQFDFRTRDAYEIAGHELTRHLNQIKNTQDRLERVHRSIDKLARIEHVPDDEILHEFKTVKNAIQTHLLFATETLQNFLITPRVDSKSDEPADEYSKAILVEAKRRQDAFNREEKKATINLRFEIEEVCNSFTKVMSAKKVRWDRSRFGPLPKVLELEKHNFHTIFANLVDNAVKYSKPGTTIKLISDFQELQVVLTLTNVGPPIDIRGAERSDIYMPRYRGQLAEKMASGRGLGLWQARLVARLWGGDPLKLAFCELLGREPSDTQPWASIGFRLDVPINNPDHIVMSEGRRK